MSKMQRSNLRLIIHFRFFFSELFEGCNSVSDLGLSANRLRLVPSAALEPLKASLGTLDLGENQISDLGPRWLSGFVGLYGLRLAENHLTNLSAQVFDGAFNIKMLNLASNRLKTIALETFAPLKKLEVKENDTQIR